MQGQGPQSAYVQKEDDFCDSSRRRVAEVDTTTVPEDAEVEIVDFDELDEPETDYLKLLSAKVRAYVKARRAVDF